MDLAFERVPARRYVVGTKLEPRDEVEARLRGNSRRSGPAPTPPRIGRARDCSRAVTLVAEARVRPPRTGLIISSELELPKEPVQIKMASSLMEEPLDSFVPTERTRVRRHHERGHSDRETT